MNASAEIANKKNLLHFLQSLLNSYAVLFFSQSNVLAALLIVASFLHPVAGFTGLCSVVFALAVVKAMGHGGEQARMGLYSFNSLLVGLGFGSFYHPNPAFWCWLAAASFLAVILSVNFSASFGKIGLPALSLPFVVVFWLVLLAANGYGDMGLLPKDSYLLNELALQQQPATGQLFSTVNDLPISDPIRLFFRALSAILFQDSVMAGIVISVGVLFHSRIGFSLLVLSCAFAWTFNRLTGIYPEGLGHYHLGVNMMMTAMAIGSFFTVPGPRSFLLALVSIVVSYLLVGACTTVLAAWNLPVFSLPFCIGIGITVYFLRLRATPGKLVLTPLQYYSPETNLSLYLNGQDRLYDLAYARLNLPFMGNWTVSQGYDGTITHKGEWSKALDFVITDDDGLTYRGSGALPEHYYCYSKPVLACADGIVEIVESHVDDNAIHEVNTLQNWGNTVVIKHREGLYSKVSHLKQHSVKVKPGEFVKQGDILALCGNSGRSPEPHLHFQVQTTPYIGSKTLAYPIATFKVKSGAHNELVSFGIPREGMEISSPPVSTLLQQVFDFQPGYQAVVSADHHPTETWKVYTDVLNQTYFFSEETGATAYFINNGAAFYFTSFFGNRSSLLYLFYLAAFKVIFTPDEHTAADDVYPLDLRGNTVNLWLHDLISPFYRYISRQYSSGSRQRHDVASVFAKGFSTSFGRRKQFMEAEIRIVNGNLSSFTVEYNGVKTLALWQPELP